MQESFHSRSPVAILKFHLAKHWRLATALLALTLFACTGLKGEYRMALFDLGSQRMIEVLAANDVEVTQAFYYRVKVGDRIVVPLCMICGGHDTGKVKFKVITAKKGDLVGVFEERYPNEILAMHDFSANLTWPQGRSMAESESVGKQLLKELQAEHLDQPLKTGPGTGCN